MKMKVKVHKYKVLNFLTRKFEVHKTEPPLDIKKTFLKFANGGNLMFNDQLLQFMMEYQGEKNCTIKDLEPIIEKILHEGNSTCNAEGCKGQGLSLNDFINFLLLHDFNGHNSYLTGNQLTSECSDEPIIEALLHGVRVIELDLWPASSKDGIKVVHGRTLTTPVSLIKCLESIKKYAFIKSDFPVILTLEDHLTSTLQAKFAEIATEIFGDMLHCPQTDCLTEFPSPESLKKQVVISTKLPKEDPQNEEELCGKALLDSMVKLKTEYLNESYEDEEDISTKKPNLRGAVQYKHLITIHGVKSKGTIKELLKVDGKVRRLSLSEKKLKSASESHGTDIIRFTRENILRVFPNGERVKSSNFRPHLGWMYGAQMVAFNIQGHGKPLWYQQGMFRANGGCGYVKKPEFLLCKQSDKDEFDPKRTSPVKKILKVKVYNGEGWKSDFSSTHFDLFSPPDFYTKVCIVGVPADSVKKHTSVVMNKWFPVWDEEFEFPLTVPKLALLRIQVKDKDKGGKDDFAGQNCLPVPELRHGFRSVPLYDKRGKKYESVKLLMRFQLENVE
ncbi:hypothetical protein TanjilG_16180 [Lupinus angustifolius]|uniref:Phosphoinositide phospholipase C n=1 Tax=Lupinus angustifolius TaxID=3871 RepID=A0A1J7GAN0_LUPAN|nr:hypothetical protein TanjilG_16180 [Lupinus angustifolius]